MRERAEFYLERGEEFSYVQLVLLALLSITRRTDLPRGAAVLLRRILDGAASVVNDILEDGREPMVCSELVYRCFNEALPGDDDAYTLGIAGRGDAFDREGAIEDRGETILERIVRTRGAESWKSVPTDLAPRPPRSADEVLAELRPHAEAAMQEIDDGRYDADRVPAGDLLEDPELRAAVDRFVLAIARVEERPGAVTSGAPLSGRDLRAAYTLLAGPAPFEFGTPRDLSECPQLELVGRYRVRASRRPA